MKLENRLKLMKS